MDGTASRLLRQRLTVVALRAGDSLIETSRTEISLRTVLTIACSGCSLSDSHFVGRTLLWVGVCVRCIRTVVASGTGPVGVVILDGRSRISRSSNGSSTLAEVSGSASRFHLASILTVEAHRTGLTLGTCFQTFFSITCAIWTQLPCARTRSAEIVNGTDGWRCSALNTLVASRTLLTCT